MVIKQSTYMAIKLKKSEPVISQHKKCFCFYSKTTLIAAKFLRVKLVWLHGVPNRTWTIVW